MGRTRDIGIGTINVEDLFKDNASVNDYLYLEDIKNRRLTLKGDITVDSIEEISKQILRYNAIDKGVDVSERIPILLYIISDGGDVDSGFELIDVIENSKTPVHVINLSYCYSMAFLVYLAGHKRYASKNATFMIHDGNSYVSNSGGKAQDTMNFINKMEKKIKEFVVRRTNISANEYSRNLRKEWYMYAEDAKKKGVVDAILGEDIDIDDVS